VTVVADPRTTTSASRRSGLSTMLAIQLRTGWKPIAIWVASIIGTYLVTIAAIDAAYPDAVTLQSYGAAMEGNAAVAAINGTPYGADNLGGVTANEFGFMAAILFPLMATHLITRATRSQEASGLLELVRSRCVARRSPTVSAVITTLAATLSVAFGIMLCALGFGIDAGDAVLYALSLAGLGTVWVAIAALIAQLVRLPGKVYAISLVLLGVAYATRAIGDVHDNGWKWLSPLAWQQETRPFATDARWWPLLLPAVTSTTLIVIAIAESGRRDLGSGVLNTRAGPARAAPHRRSMIGLAVGTHRAAIAGWAAGAVGVAVVFGALSEAVADAVATNPAFATLDGGADAYLALSLLLLVLMASGCAAQGLSKLRGAELDGSLEPTLARPTSRHGWIGAHLAVVAVGFSAVTLISALALGITVGDLGNDGNQTPALLGSALAYLPAIAVIAGVSVALFGWLPRLQALTWVLVGYAAFIGFVGPSLDVDEWVLRISPLYSVGFVPADDPSAGGIAALGVIAVAIAAVGFIGFRRRDVPSH
jgi:ABC-2 type transport system permease protein